MVAHTAGPWMLRGDDEGISILAAGDDELAQPIAVVMWRGDDGEPTANSRLIIAAPDMMAELDVREGDLFLLRKAVEAGDPKDELLVRIDDMLRETRAATAKARGDA